MLRTYKGCSLSNVARSEFSQVSSPCLHMLLHIDLHAKLLWMGSFQEVQKCQKQARKVEGDPGCWLQLVCCTYLLLHVQVFQKVCRKYGRYQKGFLEVWE